MLYELRKIELQLKTDWKISRNNSKTKTNFILKSIDGHEAEIAPNIRYGECSERVEKEFQQYLNTPQIIDKTWSHCFKNAIYNLDLKVKAKGDVYSYLNLEKQNEIETSFTIPIMDESELKKYIKDNAEFEIYKVKIDNKSGASFLKKITEFTDKRLRVDANEAFTHLEQYLDFEKAVKDFNIEFIEQPFMATQIEDYKKLFSISRFEIIADESLCSHFDEQLLPKLFHGVNVKLMKAPGIVRAKNLLLLAKKHKMKTMLGCMIETSLGIRDASYLSSLCDYIDLDGALLISNDPYRNLCEIKNGKLKFYE